jgi:hypothetical protein
MPTKTSILFVLLVLVVVAAPTQVSADLAFPQNGATLTYSLLSTAGTSQGNITATSTDSYSFQQIGNQWNVTEMITGKVTCFPSTAQLSVKFHTRSDIMGVNSSVSTNPNINIPVSYVIQDRIIMSSSIGPNAPVGFTAKCALGETDVGTIYQDTGAVLAGGLLTYVFFYIETAGLTKGSTVHISIMTVTISGTQNVTVMNIPRPAFVGTISGIFGGTFYWDRDSGILLLAESTANGQSDRMLLTNTSIPFTATTSTTALVTTSASASQATVITPATSATSSIVMSQTQTALASSPLSITAMIGLGLVALVVIVVLVLAMLRRRSASLGEIESRKKPSEISAAAPVSYEPVIPPSPKVAASPESEQKVCIYCGAKIHQGNARCPECGRLWAGW